MNIGLDLRFWRSSTGGLGRYSRNLLKELLELDRSRSYTVIITPEDEREFQLKYPNVKKIVVPIDHYSLSEQRELPKILNRERFDLVHFANFNHPILYRGPFVATIHDLIMDLYPSGSQKNSFIRKLAYDLVMNDCKRAKKVIVPSESTKQDLISRRSFPAEKIVVTPEGSEAGFRIHSHEEKEAIRRRYKLPKRYLLFVSRWEDYKGLPMLLNAYSSLKEDYPDLGLVICGQPDKQNPDVANKVIQAQNKDSDIRTPGFVPDKDLQAIYAAAAIYVHPSWYEGFGIMILEAFASGVPVVTSNVSSLPEVVGDAGLLIDPHSRDALTGAIRQILNDSKYASELVERGLSRVAKYSWKTMAEQTLAVYKEIARG